MTKYKITIEGMHCAACASNVERALKKIPGVREASVSILTKKGFVEGEAKEEEVKKIIEKIGYRVSNIEVV